MIILAMTVCGFVLAGDLTPPAGPDDPESAMFTLGDIYNRLNDGAPGVKRITPYGESSGVFGSSGQTLNEIMEKAPAKDDANGAVAADVMSGKTFWGLTGSEWGLRTGTGSGGNSSTGEPGVAKTGQIGCWDTDGNSINCAGTGQDGDHQAGVEWPDPRFTDHENGTVTDNLTGLIWLQNPYCDDMPREVDWLGALSAANTLADGMCYLEDGSMAGDWRLANIKELLSLRSYGELNRNGLPADNPFSVPPEVWSSTTFAEHTPQAWHIDLDGAYMRATHKNLPMYWTWPVRGGQ